MTAKYVERTDAPVSDQQNNSGLYTKIAPSLDDYRALNHTDSRGQSGNTGLHDVQFFDVHINGDDDDNGGKHKSGDRKGDIGDALSDLKELKDAQDKANEEAAKYGLKADVHRNKDGEIEYSFYYEVTKPGDNGKGAKPERHEALKTTDGDYGKSLDKAYNERVKGLEDTFHLDINTDVGSTIESGEEKYTVRKPSWEELDVLADSLYRSQPDTLTHSDEPFKVNFVEGDPNHTGGFYSPGTHQITLVNLENFNTEEKRKVIEHEIAHHGQEYSTTGEEANDKYYRSIGYEKLPDGVWAVRTADGELYAYDNDKNVYARRDKDGNYLDKDGKRVDGVDQADQIDDKEMRNRADIPHIHNGQPSNPWELDAEAEAYFRHSEEYRAQVYETDPDLYYKVKAQDQDKINRAYGTNEDGSPKWIRQPDGNLVPNTEESRQAVSEYEADLRQKYAPPAN